MLVLGKNAVLEALNGNLTVEKVMITKTNNDKVTNEIISIARDKKIKLQFMDKFLLDKLTGDGRHQGVICYTTEFEYCELSDIIQVHKDANTKAFIVILDSIEDPHNLGSIIRSVECCGADGIIIAKNRACSVNDTVIKISQGAVAHVKICMVTNINDAIRELKDEFINIYACDMDGESVYKSHLDQDIALIIGGENTGVKQLTKKLSDKIISLPIKGKVNSLNASNAAAVMLYEVLRQRLD